MEDVQTKSSMPVSSSHHKHSKGANPRMASFSDRLLAYIIDYFILAAFSLAFYGILYPAYFFNLSSVMQAGPNAMQAAFAGPQMILSSISLVIFFAYFGWFYTNKGQTPGKMVMKIKVVRAADLQYLNWSEAIIREVVRVFLSGMIMLLGYLWYFMSEKRQTWHDAIAGTYVVKTDDAGNLLMDGPAMYPKQPVKTFSCCGGCGLFVIIIIGLIAWGIAVAANSPELQKVFMEEFNENGTNEDTRLRDEIINGIPEFENEEEMMDYFKENYPDEYEQMKNLNNPETTPQSL